MKDIFLKSIENGIAFDVSIEDQDLETDEGLRTAVILSLFTDRRVKPEELPAGTLDPDRRGWWGDALSEVEGDQIGSKWWLLVREKQTEETRKRYQEYAEEALQWLIEDGVAQSITVEAEFVSRSVLGVQITIPRPGNKEAFRYNLNWNFESNRIE